MMHNLLEQYLEEVAGHLADLPPARRTEELRETRTHLENAVIVGRESGRTEDEAARVAVAQYGAAKVVGKEIAAAWRRGRDRDIRSFLGASACTVAVTAVLARITAMLGPFLPPAPAHGLLLPPYSLGMWAEWVIWLMPLCLLIGGVSGLLFPRRAVAGVLVGLDVFLLCFVMGGSTVTALLTGGAALLPFVHDSGDTLLVGFSAGVVLILGAAAMAWAVSIVRGAEPPRWERGRREAIR